MCNQRGHCLPMIVHWYKLNTFEQQSNVPDSDFIEKHIHTHTLHGKSHQDILIVFGCSPPLPISLSASQPQTQHFSYDFTYRLGKITPLYTMSAKWGVLSSWFGHRRLEDMGFRERVWAVLIKWYKDLIDQQVLQVLLRVENAGEVTYSLIVCYTSSTVPFRQWTAMK